MKKLIITCLLISAASVVSFAQNTQTTQNNVSRQGPTTEQAAEQRARIYEKQLGLTPEQYKGVYEAELMYIRQDQSMRTNGNKPTDGMQQQNLMGRDQRFKSVMTADQYSRYSKMNSAPMSKPAGSVPAAH
jgi:hypothetical protein